MNKLNDLGRAARAASNLLKSTATEQKNEGLKCVANLMRTQRATILAANAKDLEAHKTLPAAQIDRLLLDDKQIEAMAASLEKIATLDDPVGTRIKSWTVENGLRFSRARVPIGVIGIIFESRPNVTSDAAALCLKSGNACILRPGSECFLTAQAIGVLFSQALAKVQLPAACVQLVPTPDRELVGELLRLDEHVDLIIPRGGTSLIQRVKAESRIPILAHLNGNNHVYVDCEADLAMARQIVMNAKMRRTSICGAAETLLIHEDCLATHAAPILSDLKNAGCEIRAEARLVALFPELGLRLAEAEDWQTEYLDAILAVKTVPNIESAIDHIEHYGSRHTDCIVTNNEHTAQAFLSGVDSAIVMHNASTQFADGGEFGMGAEIGIATGRLHARGPVGLEELTTYKTIVSGNGQLRAL